MRLSTLPRPEACRASLRAPLVLVTGGKGGIGKTTLSSALAHALTRRGRRVLLVDLDLGLANINVLLRLAPRFTIEDALLGRCTLAECVVRTSAGLDVLAASSGTRELACLPDELRTRLLAELRELSRAYDVLIADSAAGIGPDVLEFCGRADHVLVVTTPDATALTDAYGLIKALHALSLDQLRDLPTPELVVNRARGLEEAEQTAARLRQTCERFLARSPRSAGWLPFDPERTETLAAGEERGPRALGTLASLAEGCLARLAARVERLIPTATLESERSREREA